MKKILLSVCALAAMTANAQEMKQVDYSVIGASAEKTYVATTAGTTFAATDHITMSAAFDDQYQYVGCSGPKVDEKEFTVLTVNGENFGSDNYGLQGKTNPVDKEGANSANSSAAPASGAVFKFTTSASVPETGAWLYVFQKASSNKQYEVCENGQAIGYTFVQLTDGKTLNSVAAYVLKGGQLEGEDADYNHLPAGYTIMWPETYFTGATENPAAPAKQNGLAVIKIQVFPESEYLVNACGSKMTCWGYAYDETGTATIKASNGVSELTLLNEGVAADVVVVDVVKGTTGINDAVAAKADANAPVYNLAGQRVNANFKGIAIQNGKKFIAK